MYTRLPAYTSNRTPTPDLEFYSLEILDWDAGFEPTGAVEARRRRTGGPGRRPRSREAHDTQGRRDTNARTRHRPRGLVRAEFGLACRRTRAHDAVNPCKVVLLHEM